tara:strand:- start:140 stop:571 length:432 start_codon:yes stop_codon:yes gene_type:complete
MSTRALVNIVQRQEGRSFSKTLEPSAIHTQIYKHYDGYPEALGVTLASYLKGYEIRNGIPNDYQGPLANGIGCLAAQLVSYIKDEPGDVYLQLPQNKDWESYVYYIWIKENEEIMISIFNYDDECVYVGDCESLIEKYKYNDR